MKYKPLLLLTVVLLASCSITKRRYLPGYAVNWRHQAPKTVMFKEEKTSKDITYYKNINSITLTHSNANFLQSKLNPEPLIQLQKVALYSGAAILKETGLTALKPNPQQQDGIIPGHRQNTQEICPEAKKSLRFGVLSYAIPVAGAILAIIALALFNGPASPGSCLSTGAIIGFFILGIACATGLIMPILAIIFVIKALNKINNEPDKYTGKKKATTGIILASLLIGIPLLIWLISVLSNP